MAVVVIKTETKEKLTASLVTIIIGVILFIFSALGLFGIVNFIAGKENILPPVESNLTNSERSETTNEGLQLNTGLQTTVLTYTDSNGVVSEITVEVAQTEVQREIGLMNRFELDQDKGMLFIFPEPTYVNFWMKNTYIPLDIIYLDADGKILQIEKGAKPLDITSDHSSREKIKYALEVNAGVSEINNYTKGGKFTFRDSPRGTAE